MTLALKHATDPDPCHRKSPLPVGIFRFALDQSPHDLLVGLILAQGVAELTLSLEYGADVRLHDRKVSLKISVFRLAIGQPEQDSPSGVVLAKGFRQRAALLQGLSQQTTRFCFASGFIYLPK